MLSVPGRRYKGFDGASRVCPARHAAGAGVAWRPQAAQGWGASLAVGVGSVPPKGGQRPSSWRDARWNASAPPPPPLRAPVETKWNAANAMNASPGPMSYHVAMRGLAILLLFNLVGLVLQKAAGVPLPGGVIGLILCTACLFAGIVKLEWVEPAAHLLLRHMRRGKQEGGTGGARL